MATAVLDTEPKSLADVLHELGDVPLDRIRFPVGGKVLPGFKLPLKNLFVRGRCIGNGRRGGNGARGK